MQNKLEVKETMRKLWNVVIVTNLNFFSSGLSIIFDIILINNLLSLSLNSMCYVVIFVDFCLVLYQKLFLTVQICSNITLSFWLYSVLSCHLQPLFSFLLPLNTTKQCRYKQSAREKLGLFTILDNFLSNLQVLNPLF